MWDPQADDQKLLAQVIDYYHAQLKASPAALEFLRSLGTNGEAIEQFKIGFADRTLGLKLPSKRLKSGREIRTRLERIGLFRESGHEQFSGSVVFPISSADGTGVIVNIYGRKVLGHRLRKGTPLDLWLNDQGLWNVQSLNSTNEVILCSTLLDALAFWSCGYRHATCAGADHLTAFGKFKVRRVLVTDESLVPSLLAAGLDCFLLRLPMGVASYVREGGDLAMATRMAEWLGKGKRPARLDEAATIPSESRAAPDVELPAAPMLPVPIEPLAEASGHENWAALLRKFLEWMQIRNYSPATVRNTKVYLGFFIHWADEHGITKPTEVTKQVLDSYRGHLYHYRKRNGDPMTFRSQRGRLVPIRGWFRWLTRQNHILFNPASELELPKVEHRLPKHVLTACEAEQVIAQATNVRDRAILETLYSTGIRRRELIGLCIYDLDRERGTLMVRQGKGRRDRVIPIGDRAVAWIDKYLEVRSGIGDVLFLNNLGEQFTPSQLTRLVGDFVAKAGVGKHGSCHLFRHTCATLMLENGADVRYVQAMLGHARLETTAIYTQVSIRKLKEVHTRAHPAKRGKA